MKRKLKVVDDNAYWEFTDNNQNITVSLSKRSTMLKGMHLKEEDYVEISIRKCKK